MLPASEERRTPLIYVLITNAQQDWIQFVNDKNKASVLHVACTFSDRLEQSLLAAAAASLQSFPCQFFQCKTVRNQ